jgi:hypothetical protein
MEKMTPESKKSAEPRKSDPDGIPVFELRFCVQGGRDLGLDASGGQGILRTRKGREITYYPQRRWFKVVEENRARPIYIHESWASWEPLE